MTGGEVTIGDMAPAPAADMTKLVSIHTGNNIHPALARTTALMLPRIRCQADHRGVNVSNRRTFLFLLVVFTF